MSKLKKKYLLTFVHINAREINYILKYWLFKAYSSCWRAFTNESAYSEQCLSHLYQMQMRLPLRFSSGRTCCRCEYRYYVDNDRPEDLGIMRQLALLGVTTSLHLALDTDTECTVCLFSEIPRCKRARNAILSRADREITGGTKGHEGKYKRVCGGEFNNYPQLQRENEQCISHHTRAVEWRIVSPSCWRTK